MPKAIKKDGKVFRLRKGKVVEIPPEWVGKLAYPQTIRKRNPVKRRTRKEK